MRCGDFAQAWRMSDAAMAARDPATRDDPTLPYHERWVWDGRPLADARVLVRCYHGLGDTIQFAQFLPALAARAASVTLEVQPELLRLIVAQAWPLQVVPFDVADPLPSPGVDIEIMELCHALRLAPSRAPFLRAPPAGPPGIGVCWQAGGWQPARSISPELLAPLLPAGTLSLQPGAAPFGWDALACDDVLDTARRVAGLDLVVSVDTMVAHLAGALGRATCLLLRAQADWRWGAGESVVWYGSMRAVRQAREGDWASTLRRVSRMIGTISAQ